MSEKAQSTLELEQELIRAKIRNVTAQAEKTELKTKITQGEYVKISQVKKKWADNVSKVRARLLGLHSKVAPHLGFVDPVTASETVRCAVLEILKEIAGDFEA